MPTYGHGYQIATRAGWIRTIGSGSRVVAFAMSNRTTASWWMRARTSSTCSYVHTATIILAPMKLGQECTSVTLARLASSLIDGCAFSVQHASSLTFSGLAKCSDRTTLSSRYASRRYQRTRSHVCIFSSPSRVSCSRSLSCAASEFSVPQPPHVHVLHVITYKSKPRFSVGISS